MNFGFTEEQDFLRESVRRFLDERCPMAEVRSLMASEDAFSKSLWEEMAALGWAGLFVPEEFGGAGLGWVDFVILLEEAGRSLLPSPLVASALATMAIREGGSKEQQALWLPRLAEGAAIGTLASLEESDQAGLEGIALSADIEEDCHVLSGTKAAVSDPAIADFFVVIYRAKGEVAVAIIEREAAGVSVTLDSALDESKRTGTLSLSGVRIEPKDRLERIPGEALASLLLDCGAVAVTAEALGAAEAATALTVQYAKDRVQFGSPIGRYQGVKHRLADQWVDTESIKSLLYYGAWAIENRREELPRYASLAKAYVADAFTRIGVECVQLHGAVGYTIEYDIQLYLKRSKWVRPAFGDSDYHRDRLASLRNL